MKVSQKFILTDSQKPQFSLSMSKSQSKIQHQSLHEQKSSKENTQRTTIRQQLSPDRQNKASLNQLISSFFQQKKVINQKLSQDKIEQSELMDDRLRQLPQLVKTLKEELLKKDEYIKQLLSDIENQRCMKCEQNQLLCSSLRTQLTLQFEQFMQSLKKFEEPQKNIIAPSIQQQLMGGIARQQINVLEVQNLIHKIDMDALQIKQNVDDIQIKYHSDKQDLMQQVCQQNQEIIQLRRNEEILNSQISHLEQQLIQLQSTLIRSNKHVSKLDREIQVNMGDRRIF